MRKKIFAISVFLFAAASLFAQTNAQKRESFINAAKAYLGTPYVWGGASKSGMDCSGLIVCAYREAGLGTLPHNAAQIYERCTKISASEREAGDLVFFYDGGISHVSIYIGNNQLLHAVSSGSKRGVVVSKLTETYWKEHYYSSGKIIGASGNTVASKSPSSSASGKSSSTSKKSSTSKNLTKGFSKSAAAFVDYNFIGSAQGDYKFKLNGGSVQVEYLYKIGFVGIGAMGRFTYLFDQIGNVSYKVPICLELMFGDYFGIYSGAVLSSQLGAPEYNIHKADGSMVPLTMPLYPGIFGVFVQTPVFQIGSYGLRLTQDISYTVCATSQEGAELNLREQLAAGFSFSTGIKLLF